MRYLLRRVGFYLIALWASVTINFIIPRLMPGDPAEAFLARMQGQNMSREQIQALRVEFGVGSNQSVVSQYFSYLNNVLHGNLGISSANFPEPVTRVIWEHLFWTLGLVGMAVVLSFALGTLIGIVVAWRRGSRLDTILPPVLVFISSIPYFWMALGLLYLLGSVLNWFPVQGGYDVFSAVPGWNMDFILSVIQHSILPAITMVLGALGVWVLPMRNTMVTTLSEDYVLMAKAKCLKGG
jgi:peptide/nickel transport system permease protein